MKKELVDQLIANTGTHFDESDREWLAVLHDEQGLDEELLALLKTNEERAAEAAEVFAANHGSHDQSTHGKKMGSTKDALKKKLGAKEMQVGQVHRLGGDSKKADQIEKLMKKRGYSASSHAGSTRERHSVVYTKGKSEYQMSVRTTAAGKTFSFSKVM